MKVIAFSLVCLSAVAAAQALADDVPHLRRDEALKEKLRDLDPSVRLAAIKSAGVAIGELREMVLLLAAALRDDSTAVRAAAAFQWAGLGPAAHEAIPSLIKALDDQDVGVRRWVIDALGIMAPFSKDALPHLIRAAADQKSEVRARALWALGQFGPFAPNVLPTLTKALEDNHPDVAAMAARALGDIGPEAATSVPALLNAFQRPDRRVRGGVIVAFGAIGEAHPKVIPMLLRQLEEEKEDFLWRAHVARALLRIGPPAGEAVPTLLAIAQETAVLDSESHLQLRKTAVAALGQMGKAGKMAVPALMKILEDKKAPAEFRSAVPLALMNLGEHTKETLPALVDAYFDPDNEAIGNLGQVIIASGKAAVPLVLKRTQKGNTPLVRNEALGLLGAMGPLAEEALKVLEELTEDPDRNIREEAWRAIRSIKGVFK